MDAQAKVLTVWVAYALGIVVTGTPFAGVVMAYLCRNTNGTPGFAGHNAAQIRLFWWGFLGWIVGIITIIAAVVIGVSNDAPDPPALMWIGLLLIVVVQIGFTIQSIIGIVRAARMRNWPGAHVTQSQSEVFG